jgi:hypothetical protein
MLLAARKFRSRQRRTRLSDPHQRRTDDRAAYAGSGDAVTIRSREAAVSRLSAWTTRHDLVPAGQMGEFRSYFYIR